MVSIKRKRVAYLDIAKGIGILLVLIGHLSNNYILLNFIYVFHMPLFFYIAGVFNKNDTFKLTLLKNKKFVTLYFSVGIGYILLYSLLKGELQYESFVHLVSTTPKEIYSIVWFGPLWFLLSFFIVKIFNNIIFIKSLIFSLIIFVISYYINLDYRDIMLSIPFCVGPALMLLIYYNIGKFNNIIIRYYSEKSLLILIVIFIFTMFVTIVINDGMENKLVNYHHMQISFNPFFGLMLGITGVIVTLYLSKFIQNSTKIISNILSYFGRNSLFIFIIHLLLFFISKRIILKLFENNLNEIILKILIFTLTLVISSLLITLNHKLRIKKVTNGKCK